MTDSKPIYYIRFLKPPPTTCLIGQHFTIVWTIESDLGDQSFWETVPVTINVESSARLGLRELNADPKGNSKKRAQELAKPYLKQKVALAKSIPIVFDPLRGGGVVTKLVIEQLPGQPLAVGTQVDIQLSMTLAPVARTTPSHSIWQEAYQFQSQIWLVPTWSAPITAIAAKQRHTEVSKSGDQAERVIKVNDTSVIHIREDAVQSIARHVWDCGFGMCQFLFEQKSNIKFKSILELGSGTGLVGIYAAELLHPKRAYLTDLADAIEIMEQNVSLLKNSEVQIYVKELPWGPEKDDQYQDVDLVLLTDVLYNQSSHDVLLETLDWVLENENCKALLAYKERNPDEREFFTKVEQRGWQCNRVDNVNHLICEVYWISKV